jgi:hypothetical protein
MLVYPVTSIDIPTAAVLELGALFGAIEAGVLVDKLSRRKAILVSSGQPPS